MQVNEERLGQLSRQAGDGGLRVGNPLVLEALEEILQGSPSAREGRGAGRILAMLLELDRPHAPRIRLPVAAQGLHEAAALSPQALRHRIGELALGDTLLGMACQAIAGHREDGTPRSEPERAEVERALYLVTRLVQMQEEVDALEACMAEEVIG